MGDPFTLKRVVFRSVQGPEDWECRVYNDPRWMTEMVIFTVKWMFREDVAARRLSNMVQANVLNVHLYNLFTRLNPASCAVHVKGGYIQLRM